MAEVVLFRSALGLRPGVTAAADRLRAAGHNVHTPDYYDGEVFDDLNEGLRKRDELGYAEIAQRARDAVARLPAELVFAGFSLGAMPAELLAATTPGTRGAVLMHAAIPVKGFGGFGVERWPAGVPVQAHYAAEDPWVEAGEVAALGDAVRGAGAALRSTPTRALGTCSPTRTCPGTISRRPRRCGGGCSPSSTGSTPDARASRGGCPGARALPGSPGVLPALPARRRTAGGPSTSRQPSRRVAR